MRSARALGQTLLVLYVGALVLAALPDWVRPAWLDRPHRSAYRLLNRVGIRAGMNVFQASVEGEQFWTTHDCFEAWERGADGAERRIFEACPNAGLRIQKDVYETTFDHWLMAQQLAQGVVRQRQYDMAVDWRHRASPEAASIRLTRRLGRVLYATGDRSEQILTLDEGRCE